MIDPSVTPADEAQPPQLGAPAVRFATPGDEPYVEELHAIAFGPGRFARTAFRVRERFPIDPSLSMIGEIEGERGGSVWMTPISVGGIDGYMLGPLATHPAFRKRGLGRLLAREVTRIALERGEGSFVLLIGDQDYYCPLGWQPTTACGIVWPGPVDPERVLVYSHDKTLAVRLAGRIAAFGAKRQS